MALDRAAESKTFKMEVRCTPSTSHSLEAFAIALSTKGAIDAESGSQPATFFRGPTATKVDKYEGSLSGKARVRLFERDQ